MHRRMGSWHTLAYCELIWVTCDSLACSAGILLVRANAKSSRSFIQPVISDLQLEWTVGVGGGGGEKVIFTPLPPPLSLFLTVDSPLGRDFFSPQP